MIYVWSFLCGVAGSLATLTAIGLAVKAQAPKLLRKAMTAPKPKVVGKDSAGNSYSVERL